MQVIKREGAAPIKLWVGNKKDDFGNEVREVHKTLETLFNSAVTVKRLREIWPEGKGFIPTLPVVGTALVPAGLTDKLNAMMGLKAA